MKCIFIKNNISKSIFKYDSEKGSRVEFMTNSNGRRVNSIINGNSKEKNNSVFISKLSLTSVIDLFLQNIQS